VASAHNGPPLEHDAIWRGIDLSGVTVVLGVGEGRLIETLAGQARASGSGHILAIGFRIEELARLRYRLGDEPVSQISARPRAIPLQDGTVDLLVMSGTLRQVPVTSMHTLFEEVWRVLVPGGQIRIADIIEPSEAPYNEAWRQRNALISKLAGTLNRPTALYANLTAAAEALNARGFENLAVSLLPGYPLTEAWLESTEEAVISMLSRVVDPELRQIIVQSDLPRLLKAFQTAGQRAAERFVLRGSKVGNLSLDMEASFTEDDLAEEDED
jgi:SAM-dependent methyltransferase